MKYRTALLAFRPCCLRAAAVLLAFVPLVSTFSGAQEFQSWNEVDLTTSWRNVDFLLPLLARLDATLANPQLAATGIEADFPLRWHLTATGGYLFAVLPQRSLEVHLPLVAIATSCRFRRFTLADRNRFEKLIGFESGPVRYRNRFLVDRDIGRSRRWHAFVDNEVIFNLSAGGWNQNRFQLGGGTRFTPRLSFDVYYLRRDLSSSTQIAHVLGTTLKIGLNRRKETDRCSK